MPQRNGGGREARTNAEQILFFMYKKGWFFTYILTWVVCGSVEMSLQGTPFDYLLLRTWTKFTDRISMPI